jgi:antitoxin ParD1/3/4
MSKEERDLIRAAKLEALRQEIQAGLDSGPATPLDFEDIKRRGREQLARQQAKAE